MNRFCKRGGSRLVLLVLVSLLLGLHCPPGPFPDDDMLNHDLFDPDTGQLFEISAGAPVVMPGPDGLLGTPDDRLAPLFSGDVDLVIRAGSLGAGPRFPAAQVPASAPTVITEPFGAGGAVAFSVGASAGGWLPEVGLRTQSPNLEGVPVVATAFADLDGDGFIGVTRLDQNPADDLLEQAELIPVGRNVAIASNGVASGSLRIRAAGPSGAPLVVLLAAGAWVGPLDPAFLSGVVPDGPLVSTQLPFLPRSDPNDILGGAVAPISAGSAIRVEIEEVLDPDPLHPLLGEGYTIPVDGSATSNDLVIARAGAMARFGLAKVPVASTYQGLPQRPMRPALDDAGNRVVVEVLERLVLADDGNATTDTLRVVPLDALGNVTDPSAPNTVLIRSEGEVQILSPDVDGDPTRERVTIADARGVSIVVDDAGGALDGPNRDALVIDGGAGLQRIVVFLPDPDVDDSGAVTGLDVSAVARVRGARIGELEFDPDFDLDGSGRIDDADRDLVQGQLGQSVPQP